MALRTVMQGVEAIETGLSGDARRVRAHARAVNHSARVRRLRWIIPLAAGTALLVVGFVALRPLGGLPGVTLGPVSLSGTKVMMENPRLSGFRKGERGYEVTAKAALQDVRKPTLVELQGMNGRIDTDDKGGVARIEAATGLFDTGRETLTLERDIRLWTDKGETMRLNSAAIDFKAGTVRSREAVTVTIPRGSVVADSLDVAENGHVISFVGNVRTLLQGGDGEPAPRIRTSAAETPDRDARP